MQELDDDQFVSDLASGDSSAFRKFYDYYFRRLPSLIRKSFPYLKNDALDLTQDTMIKIRRNLWRFDGWNQAQIGSYVRTTAFSVAFNYSRNKVRRGEIPIEDILSAIEDPTTSDQSIGIKASSFLANLVTGDSEKRRVEAMRVKCALEQIKTVDHDIIFYIDMLGVNPKNLAKATNVTIQAIYKSHQRARKRFIAFYQMC